MAVIERRRHSQGGRGAGAVPQRLREHRTRNVPLLVSKLTAPAPRPASVPRPGLVNRLRVARAASVVLVHAPPGHGKTTLVADWARRDDRPFAWYRIDEGDDPHAFVTYLTAAVSRLCASTANGAKVPDADSEPEETAALLGHRLRSCGHSIVIVLDDVGLVQDERSIRLLARFVEELPTGSQLVLVSSSEPQLPVARLRAQRQLVELGPDDLRFSDREAGALMRNAGVELANADVAALNDAVEGWAVALYLSALSFSSAGTNAATPAEVGAELLSEHFTGLLSELADDEIRFLTRTSVLDRLSGPLCDTVADAGDSAELLARLERAKCFVVPLDRVGDSYRVHRALRDVLTAELERREPGVEEILRSRAAGWYAAHDDLELALDHACSAGDRDQLVELVERSALPFDSYARPGKVERWLGALDDDKLLAQHPAVAASGALTWAMAGHAEDAERWAAALRPRSARRSAHWQALLRCLMCPAGADEMRADANRALRGLSLDSAWRPAALFSLGVAHGLGGAFSTAQSVLREAAETAASVGAAGMESVVLGYHSMLATSLGEWTLADTLADSACRTVHDSHLVDRVTSLFAYAASARASSWGGASRGASCRSRTRPHPAAMPDVRDRDLLGAAPRRVRTRIPRARRFGGSSQAAGRGRGDLLASSGAARVPH